MELEMSIAERAVERINAVLKSVARDPIRLRLRDDEIELDVMLPSSLRLVSPAEVKRYREIFEKTLGFEFRGITAEGDAIVLRFGRWIPEIYRLVEKLLKDISPWLPRELQPPGGGAERDREPGRS